MVQTELGCPDGPRQASKAGFSCLRPTSRWTSTRPANTVSARPPASWPILHASLAAAVHYSHQRTTYGGASRCRGPRKVSSRSAGAAAHMKQSTRACLTGVRRRAKTLPARRLRQLLLSAREIFTVRSGVARSQTRPKGFPRGPPLPPGGCLVLELTMKRPCSSVPLPTSGAPPHKRRGNSTMSFPGAGRPAPVRWPGRPHGRDGSNGMRFGRNDTCRAPGPCFMLTSAVIAMTCTRQIRMRLLPATQECLGKRRSSGPSQAVACCRRGAGRARWLVLEVPSASGLRSWWIPGVWLPGRAKRPLRPSAQKNRE